MGDFFRKIMTDETRALIVAFFPDLINLFVALGVNISEGSQILIMSILTKVIVFVFYLYKTGQNQTLAAKKRGK